MRVCNTLFLSTLPLLAHSWRLIEDTVSTVNTHYINFNDDLYKTSSSYILNMIVPSGFNLRLRFLYKAIGGDLWGLV